MKRWKPIVNAGVFLLLGIALGVSFNNWQMERVFERRFSHPKERGAFFLEHFANRLNLSTAQREKAKEIFAEQREKLDELRGKIDPQFQTIREDTRGKIRAILSLEQQKRFDRFHERRGERRSDHRGFGGGKGSFGQKHAGPPGRGFGLRGNGGEAGRGPQ